MRRLERQSDFYARRVLAARQEAATLNAGLLVQGLFVKGRPQFVEADDLLRTTPAVDEDDFYRRQRASDDRRIRSMIERPLDQIKRLVAAKDGTQEGWRLRAAAERYLPAAPPELRERLRYVIGHLQTKDDWAEATRP